MDCWNCGIEVGITSYGKLSFRAMCDNCSAELHCCLNCKYYQPGLPNDCQIRGTEFIADRSRNNFCEEFSALGKFVSKKTKPKSNFDDLFK